MGQLAGLNAAGNPITLEQYRALELTRPITDQPIGGLTESRRSVDAAASAVHTVADSAIPDGPPATWKPVDHPHDTRDDHRTRRNRPRKRPTPRTENP